MWRSNHVSLWTCNVIFVFKTQSLFQITLLFIDIILFYFRSALPVPVKFPRSYLSRPTITHRDEERAEVTLVCKVPINPTIMQWKNVTYVVHWYADGRHVYTEPQFCKPTNESAGANDQPCPGKNEIRSFLRGTGKNYYPGQRVSNFVRVIFFLHYSFVIMLLLSIKTVYMFPTWRRNGLIFVVMRRSSR